MEDFEYHFNVNFAKQTDDRYLLKVIADDGGELLVSMHKEFPGTCCLGIIPSSYQKDFKLVTDDGETIEGDLRISGDVAHSLLYREETIMRFEPIRGFKGLVSFKRISVEEEHQDLPSGALEEEQEHPQPESEHATLPEEEQEHPQPESEHATLPEEEQEPPHSESEHATLPEEEQDPPHSESEHATLPEEEQEPPHSESEQVIISFTQPESEQVIISYTQLEDLMQERIKELQLSDQDPIQVIPTCILSENFE